MGAKGHEYYCARCRKTWRSRYRFYGPFHLCDACQAEVDAERKAEREAKAAKKKERKKRKAAGKGVNK
jgi:hypothetical protein